MINTKPKHRRFAWLSMLVVAALMSACVVQEQGESGGERQGEFEAAEVRNPPIDLTAQETTFLNCAVDCRSTDNAGPLFQCLSTCEQISAVSPAIVQRMVALGIGSSVTEGECSDILRTNFVCPLFGGGCCCEGFFDCQAMEKVVIGCKVDACNTDANGREICSCKFK